MDIFQVRDRLIEDYREFTGSFVDIHDKAIREHVDERMANGYQWPDPWLSLNPSFASGGTVSELIDAGAAPAGQQGHLPASERPGASPSPAPEGGHRGRTHRQELRPHDRHRLRQEPGVHRPDRRQGPRSQGRGTYQPGIKAIVVYPMNALANSQLGELEKFLGTSNQPVTLRSGTPGRSRRRSAPASSRTRRTSCSPTT